MIIVTEHKKRALIDSFFWLITFYLKEVFTSLKNYLLNKTQIKNKTATTVKIALKNFPGVFKKLGYLDN